MKVDLNSDVGEGFGRWQLGADDDMLEVVTSINIACGFHAGDPLIMDRLVGRAVERGVNIGAQPGFNDLWGFGRRRISGDTPEELAAMVVYQLGALVGIAARRGARVRHVKLHGALNALAASESAVALAIASAVAEVDRSLLWFAPAGSAMVDAGHRAGLQVAAEGFADRGYAADGSLLDRSLPEALVDDPLEVGSRAVALVFDGVPVSADGVTRWLHVDTICVHGDNPGAGAQARAVRQALADAGAEVIALR